MTPRKEFHFVQSHQAYYVIILFYDVFPITFRSILLLPRAIKTELDMIDKAQSKRDTRLQVLLFYTCVRDVDKQKSK